MLKNGYNIDYALEQFTAHKNKSSQKEGYSYFKIEEYTELLDRCFGPNGYRSVYSEERLEALPNGQCIIFAKCTIKVLDVEDKEVYQMEGYGSYELTYSETKGKFINLSTAGINASVNALKSACINAGAFGSRKFDKKPDAQRNQSQNSNTPSEVVVKSFYVESMEVFWHDKDGRPAYRLTGKEVVSGNKMRQETTEVLLYPNQYRWNENKVNELVSSGKGKVVRIKVSPVAENKRNPDFFESYVFKGF